jgi:hypothetical protein
MLVVGCSPEPAVEREIPAGPNAQQRHSIDVSAMGAPAKIRGLEVEARPAGRLAVSYRVDATGPALVPVRTMCRVGQRNVMYPMTASGKVAGPRLSSLYRPAPFSDAPAVCQLDFFYAPAEQARWQPAGRACWRAGALRDGACPDASFPPPELASAGAVVLEQTALELHDSSATVTALFTLAQPVSDDRRFAAAIRCEDATGPVAGEAALTFVPLGEVPVGASVFGPITFALERTPTADARCVLDILSRSVAGGPSGDRIHAQYCVTTRSVRVGRC